MESPNSTPVPTYQKNVESINAAAQSLLERYSGLSSAEVIPHVLSLRDKAFKVYHYPCIGQMRFLAFNFPRMPFYHRVLERLRTDPSTNFLDAGCCFGQEIRHLVDQGIPGKQLFGCDLEQVFIDLGYELFRDKDHLEATFATGDLTADDPAFAGSPLSQNLSGKIDIIFASSLFHLWDYDTQVRAAIRLVQLCRDKTGVMITGRQLGSRLGGHYPIHGVDDKALHYRHNVESLKGFWRDVEVATQTRWKLEASFFVDDAVEQTKKVVPDYDSNAMMICWCVTRE
ncbi:hypothetical protein BDV38DRAFT_295638 [Aspergillus pseudotamarii]|uniref:Methyltransferase type 11 domain-containing protein n=1 Tax=Aspergillus pseudotamarii TaxID=132259 RepID=A0A5N6T662_ASPPS|nr:uncharacterized protein BDV38DRAFT_295638 [Aspergillus pseudotamarii]KAE8141814.1 hypothetical protein BDV38DRAFT_295638 [Aspergillus pseudotamarii]